MDIYLIRHGLTQHNIEYRFGGFSDVPVTPQGLAALHPADFAPPVVYTSGLQRTQQTARAIFPASRLQPVPGLNEMNFGDFEGKSYEEMKDDADFLRWVENKNDMTVRCRGGETRQEYTDRVLAAFDALVDEALARGEERLVIVAHGGTQMVVMCNRTDAALTYHEGQTVNGGCRLLRAEAGAWAARRQLRWLDTLFFAQEP